VKKTFRGIRISKWSLFPQSVHPLTHDDQKPRLGEISFHGILYVSYAPWLLKKSGKISLDGKAGVHHHVLHPFQRIDLTLPTDRETGLLRQVKSAPRAFPGDKTDEYLSFSPQKSAALSQEQGREGGEAKRQNNGDLARPAHFQKVPFFPHPARNIQSPGPIAAPHSQCQPRFGEQGEDRVERYPFNFQYQMIHSDPHWRILWPTGWEEQSSGA